MTTPAPTTALPDRYDPAGTESDIYAAWTAAGLFTNAFFGLMIAYVLLDVYEQRDEVGGYDAVEAVTRPEGLS